MSLMITIQQNDSSIKFEGKVIKSSLRDYSDAHILVTGDITATGGDENTDVAFKNCTPFTRCVNHLKTNTGNPDNVPKNNSASFKYK